jgi:uncharacterized repeat protein (TIGR03843 family)
MKSDEDQEMIIEILEKGRIEMEGLVPWGSNYTFLVQVVDTSKKVDAIYKPSQGERPLWDFARGSLGLRERAAFLVCELLGWQFVPPTVLRDGPHGYGSVQFFVEHDPKKHYLVLEGKYRDQTRQIALFDIIINNADRKSGHVLLGVKEHLWAIDHGICFHSEYKLRSVIWDYAGEPIPEYLLADLEVLKNRLCYGDEPARIELEELLSDRELTALHNRLNELLEEVVFPEPGPGRHYPWPLV